MGRTTIEWTARVLPDGTIEPGHTINPIRARSKATGAVGHYCEKIAAGCTNCYASNLQRRFQMPSFGSGQYRDKIELFLDESKLDEVRRRKKPTRYFWCDMTDMFGDWVKPSWVGECFRVMAETPRHTHMVLTKRPNRVRGMLEASGRTLDRLESLWLGTSVSSQFDADSLVPDLLRCRDLAPVLFLSCEPLLGPIDLDAIWPGGMPSPGSGPYVPSIDWAIVGGESGLQARPCNVQWIRGIVKQCADADVPCFVKQLGSSPRPSPLPSDLCVRYIKDNKGGEISEWPTDLRVRQFPKASVPA